MSDAAGRGRSDPATLDRQLAAGALALALLAPRVLLDDGRTICPIRRATGLPCPTCGLTRSIHAAGRLRLRQSLAHHPLGIPVLGAALFFAAGRWRPSGPDERPSPTLLAGAVVWVTVWLVRLRMAAAAR